MSSTDARSQMVQAAATDSLVIASRGRPGNVGGSCYGWVVSEETVFPPFRVSEAAVSQIVAVGGSVRVDITAGGCCGRTYVFTSDAPDAGDEGSARVRHHDSLLHCRDGSAR
jgi:hypothetical protein